MNCHNYIINKWLWHYKMLNEIIENLSNITADAKIKGLITNQPVFFLLLQ